MKTTPSGVLKKDAVKMTETPRQVREPPASGRARPAGAANARIVSLDDAGAIIEVTCACGEKTLLACEWASQQPAPAETPDEAQA